MFEIISTEHRKGNGFDDLSGRKYGRLKVLGLSSKKSGRKSYWVCLCDCGNKHIVRSDSLKSGHVQSCGCMKNDQDRINLTKYHRHKESRTPLHHKWLGIKGRCLNPHSTSYKDYGGRGISICDQWANSYECFRDWALANGYKDGLTIERIDVNGDYEPSNCTWISFAEQAINRRSTVWIEWNGKKQNIKQWSDELGIKYGTLHARHYRSRMKPPQLFEPVI